MTTYEGPITTKDVTVSIDSNVHPPYVVELEEQIIIGQAFPDGRSGIFEADMTLIRRHNVVYGAHLASTDFRPEKYFLGISESAIFPLTSKAGPSEDSEELVVLRPGLFAGTFVPELKDLEQINAAEAKLEAAIGDSTDYDIHSVEPRREIYHPLGSVAIYIPVLYKSKI